jgi:hypothetical protein
MMVVRRGDGGGAITVELLGAKGRRAEGPTVENRRGNTAGVQKKAARQRKQRDRFSAATCGKGERHKT